MQGFLTTDFQPPHFDWLRDRFLRRIAVIALGMIVLVVFLLHEDFSRTNTQRVKAAGNSGSSLTLSLATAVSLIMRDADARLSIREAEINGAKAWSKPSEITRILQNASRGEAEGIELSFHRLTGNATSGAERVAIEQTGHHPIIAVTRKVTGPDGRVAGVLRAVVDPALFLSAFDRTAANKTATIQLAYLPSFQIVVQHALGSISFRNDIPLADVQQSAPTSPHARVVTQNGAAYALAYKKIEEYPLLVVVGIPLDGIGASGRDFSGYVSVAILFSGALVSALAFVFIVYRREMTATGAVAEKEALFQGFFKSSPTGMYVMDRNLTYKLVNPAFEQMIMMPAEQLIGTRAEVHTAASPIVHSTHLSVINEGTHFRNVAFICDAPATAEGVIHCLGSYFPLYDGNKRIAGLGAVVIDITEQKRLERVLLENQSRLSNAQRLGAIGDFEWSYEHQRLQCSDQVLRIFGLPFRPNVDLDYLLSRVLPEQRQSFGNALLSSIENKTVYSVTAHIILDDGTERYIFSRNELVLTGVNNDVAKMVGMIQDITEQELRELDLLSVRENLRTLSAHHELVLEEERKHIAREIHDELGQQLAGMQLDLSALRMDSVENSWPIQKLDKLLDGIKHTMNLVRKVAQNLRPSVLDTGLVSALEWLAEDFGHRWEIACEFFVVGDPVGMNDAYTTAVFRIAQASLTNVVRHAEASAVTITLEFHGDSLSLKVHDNGKGFDPVEVRNGNGFGLLGMRERIMALGGKLRVDTAIGQGTTISIEHLPVGAA